MYHVVKKYETNEPQLIIAIRYIVQFTFLHRLAPPSHRDISTSDVGMIGPHDHTGSDNPYCVFIHPWPSSYGYGVSKIASLAQYRAAQWFPPWIYGYRANWQWGRRAGSPLYLLVSFWSSPNILRSSVVRMTYTEDSRLSVYQTRELFQLL